MMRASPRASAPSAFTIIELLVAMSLMALILVGTLQVLTHSSAAIKIADNQRGAAAVARGALDRFAADFSTAMLTGGATAVFHSDVGIGSQIGFLCLSRTRGPSPIPRAAIVAYGIKPTTEKISGQDLIYGTLHRGDGQSLYTGGNSQFADMFANLPSDTNPPNWEPLGSGIVRFHISFVLDDGTITQTPPEYTMVSPTTGNPTTFLNGKVLGAGRIAIAFSKENAPASGRYVKSLIVAIACVDRAALAKASASLEELQSKLDTPTGSQTPLALWQQKYPTLSLLPLRQSIRFYQRTIAAQ